MEEKKKKRIGVYICHCGGNISDYVDVAQVRELAGKAKDKKLKPQEYEGGSFSVSKDVDGFLHSVGRLRRVESFGIIT